MPLKNAAGFFAELTQNPPAPKLCGYRGCEKPLGPRADGQHHTIGNRPVCEDCYYTEMAPAVEGSFGPLIGTLRRRGSGCGSID